MDWQQAVTEIVHVSLTDCKRGIMIKPCGGAEKIGEKVGPCMIFPKFWWQAVLSPVNACLPAVVHQETYATRALCAWQQDLHGPSLDPLNFFKRVSPVSALPNPITQRENHEPIQQKYAQHRAYASVKQKPGTHAATFLITL